MPLGQNFANQLRRADEIADARFANAKDVAIHDRLVKEIEAARGEQARIGEELARLDVEDRRLRQEWVSEWPQLGFEPLAPAEMKEWMQALGRVRPFLIVLSNVTRKKRIFA